MHPRNKSLVIISSFGTWFRSQAFTFEGPRAGLQCWRSDRISSGETRGAEIVQQFSARQDSMVSVIVSDDGVNIKFPRQDAGHGQQNVRNPRLGNMAERQCESHILYHPTEKFTLKTDGRFSASVTEVTIHRALLESLPLLQDLKSSTNDGTPAQVDLPCSLWGLVSLLVLLEGSVTVKEWFGGDPEHQDANLPSMTLQVQHCKLFSAHS